MNIKKVISVVTLITLIVSSVIFSLPVFAAAYDVKAYGGATGNGTTLDTTAIQSCINVANSAGGGEVYFPTGTYKVTAINLKSNVTLNISSGAVIKASTVASDWSSCNQQGVIRAISQSNVVIKGTGTIDGGSVHDIVCDNYTINN